MAKTATNPKPMSELVALMGDKLVPFIQGDVLDVKVISTSKDSIITDVAGVATGIIGIPNRYMHSPVEVVSLDDLDNAAELIFRFCLSVDGNSDFTP